MSSAQTNDIHKIDIEKWENGEYHTKQQLMDCVNKLSEESAKLKEDHLLQLAAISTASMCNTEKSMESSLIGKDNPYWTVAYSDTVNAIKREVLLLAENAKLKAELGDALELLCNTQDELKKEMLVIDYYASDVWDICEDEVSGQQRSCIDNLDDDGGEIFGGKRARQRQKERDQSILK